MLVLCPIHQKQRIEGDKKAAITKKKKKVIVYKTKPPKSKVSFSHHRNTN